MCLDHLLIFILNLLTFVTFAEIDCVNSFHVLYVARNIVSYLVFDAPERRNETYEERVAHVANLIQHKVIEMKHKNISPNEHTILLTHRRSSQQGSSSEKKYR